jgi:hypothetical protein
MSIPWPDFFRPDANSSNRALKKFLQDEGLDLGHRDVVLLRQFAEARVFFSYAALECWAEGELKREQLEQLLCLIERPTAFGEFVASVQLSSLRVESDNLILVGTDGELESAELPSLDNSCALVHRPEDARSSPLLTVYGGGGLNSQPAVGGVWKEEALQAESVTLLDGESAKELVEAFRHLFRAAPNGGARASVVAAALSRHRAELDLEVAEKLEEIAPPFGQAMKQLFEGDRDLGARALQFLLKTELEMEPPPWCHFWQQIRPTILESLARSDRGTSILLKSVDQLAATITGDQFLNHQLLDAFLVHLDELSPSQQDSLVRFVVEWAQATSDARELLRSRLDLTGEQNQRLLLGECLRRTLVDEDDAEALQELARIFVAEAISAGSTAGSIALAELLRAFGPMVFEETAATEIDLSTLTERQTLNLIAIWELMVGHSDSYVRRVSELYLSALREPAGHLSLLLKSELLQCSPIYDSFRAWLRDGEFADRRHVVSVGYRWSLPVENRCRVAKALSEVEWDFLSTWEGEWRRPHLSFQRLGWLALCAPEGVVRFEGELKIQILELLQRPPVHLYFWELMRCCARFPEFGSDLRKVLLESCGRTFRRLEAHQEEERQSLYEVGAASIGFHTDGDSLLSDWPERFRSGRVPDIWWLSGVTRALYSNGGEVPVPSRELVSAIIHRLISSGEKSMKDLLSQALVATDEEEPAPDSHFVPLEVSNVTYEALAAIASHASCPAALQATIRRRLALFLISWGNQLRVTKDPYAFRETPLFAILQAYLEDDDGQLQALLKENSALFLELHRKVPDKLRLEVRHTAQQFFKDWSERNPDQIESEGWKRVLEI